MSIAKRIVQFDGLCIARIDIEDDAGAIHRYAKRAIIPRADTTHVKWPGGQTLELIHEAEGPTLQQEAAGLPEMIVVAYIELRPRGGRHRRVEFYEYTRTPFPEDL